MNIPCVAICVSDAQKFQFTKHVHLAILLVLLRVLIAAKFLDRVALVSLEILLQNLISVHFPQKYQVTVVFAVLL